MVKRPLCLAAVCVLLLLCISELCFPWKEALLCAPGETLLQEETVLLSGRIVNREQKGQTTIYFISDVLRQEEHSFQGEAHFCSSEKDVYLHTNSNHNMKIGTWIQAKGLFYPFERARNPGQFDAYTYYRSSGICGRIMAERIAKIEQEKGENGILLTIGYRLKEQVIRVREVFTSVFDQVFPEYESGILKAMILGNKNGLMDETKDLYQKAGILHILAISGLHLSFFGLSFYHLLRKAGLSYLSASLVSTAFLLLYGVLTNFPVSALRAIWMMECRLGAEVSGRTYDTLSALSLAALLMIVSNPLLIFQAGFQMSFAAVAGIGFVAPCLERLFLSYTGERFEKICKAAASALGIQLFLGPVLVCHYYEFAPFSPLFNCIVLPFVPILLGTGLLVLSLFFLFPPAAGLAALFCRFLILCLERGCMLFLSLSGGSIVTGEVSAWKIGVYYVLLVLLVFAANGLLKNVERDKNRRKGTGNKPQ